MFIRFVTKPRGALLLGLVSSSPPVREQCSQNRCPDQLGPLGRPGCFVRSEQ